MKNFIAKFVIVSSIITFVICCNGLTGTDYSALLFLPLTYIPTYFFLKQLFRKTPRYKITIGILLILLWIRMVFLPFYGVISNGFIQTTTHRYIDINMAIVLSIYETFAICLTLYIITVFSKRKKIESFKPVMQGNKVVYKYFILFAIIVFIVWGRHLNMFEFGVKTIDTERVGDIVDSNTLFIRQIVSCGYLFLFIYLIEWNRKNYARTLNDKYIKYSMILAALMTCIIVGERRTTQIYVAFASCWLLIRMYPKDRKQILTAIGTTALVVLSLMTVYKHFNAYLYSSYIDAMQNASIDEGLSSGMVDAYFYGVDTIAKNIEFGKHAPPEFINWIFDIVRSFFGLNFFVKGDMLLTSQLYNLRIYGGEQMTGYLLSSIGYGYIYFGVALAPIFSCINICLMSFLESNMRKCKSIEMSYIWAYLYMRFAFSCLGSLPPLISLCTIFLFIRGSLFLFAKSFNYNFYVKKNIL